MIGPVVERANIGVIATTAEQHDRDQHDLKAHHADPSLVISTARP
jgi:hypothetical protein